MLTYWNNHRKAITQFHADAPNAYWDDHWKTCVEDLKSLLLNSEDKIFVPLVRKYLSKNSLILEGGCGRGQIVAELTRLGYRVIGIDSASKTIEGLREVAAELDVRVGDVRKLPFADGELNGYISVGVIEHFFEGYEAVTAEMTRVLKAGGILFISFPFLSPLRQIKQKLGLYPPLPEVILKEHFYQYLLSEKSVIEHFQALGFEVLERRSYDGLKGFKDEVHIMKSYLQQLYDYRGSSLCIRFLRKFLDVILKGFSAHMRLLVLQKSVIAN